MAELLQVVRLVRIRARLLPKKKCLSVGAINTLRDCMSMQRLSNNTKTNLKTGTINRRSKMKSTHLILCWIQSLWEWHRVILSQLSRGLMKECTTLRERIRTPCFESLRSSKKSAHSSRIWIKTTMISKQVQGSPPVLERKLVPQRDPASVVDQRASSDKTRQRWKWRLGKSRRRKPAESKSSLRISRRIFLRATTLCHSSNSLIRSQMTKDLGRITKREKLVMIEKEEVLSLCKWVHRLCFSSKLQSQSTNSIHIRIQTHISRMCRVTHHKKGRNIIPRFPQSKSPSAYWRLNLTGKTSKR